MNLYRDPSSESMLENDQRYLVEILQIKFRSEEVFILTSEKISF